MAGIPLGDILNPIGSVVGGLVSGIGNIIGGNQQASAQRAANRTNLQIAQETNAQQMDMFKQQLQYNSFENQRKMLEQAGYSPYSLFGTSSVAAPSAPQLHAPQMIPEDAKGIMFQNLGASIGNSMTNLANMMATFASAKKINAEAKRQEIENDVLPELLEIQRQGGITDVVWKSLQNKLMKHQFDALAVQPDIQNQFTIGQTKLNAQQMALLAIQTALQEEYGGRLNQSEIEKKSADAFASWQKGWLDEGELKHIDDKYKAILKTADAAEKQANAAERNATVNEKRMPAQNAKDYADSRKSSNESAYYEELTYGEGLLNKFKNDNYKRFYELGLDKTEAEIKQIKSSTKYNRRQRKALIQQMDYVDELIEKARDDNELRMLHEVQRTLESAFGVMHTGGQIVEAAFGK